MNDGATDPPYPRRVRQASPRRCVSGLELDEWPPQFTPRMGDTFPAGAAVTKQGPSPGSVRRSLASDRGDERWAVFIDIEGTTSTFDNEPTLFYRRLDALLDGIVRIGKGVFGERDLFVHQTGGDGFLIVPGPGVADPMQGVAVATVLMRRLLVSFAVAKAGVAVGDFADERRRLPSLERLEQGEGSSYRAGGLALELLPCMGSALVRAHAIGAGAPRGARLAVDRGVVPVVPAGLVVAEECAGCVVLDWLHSATPEIDGMIRAAGLDLPSIPDLEGRLRGYVETVLGPPQEEWRRNTLRFAGCG